MEEEPSPDKADEATAADRMEENMPPLEIPVKCEIIEISDEEVNSDPTTKKKKRKPYKKDPLKAVQCEVCSRTLGDKHQLKKHMLVHSDERPFVCAHCGKAYRYKHVLKQHEMSHYGQELQKSFTCTVCGAAFTRGSSLNTHMKIHSGERPFACPMCDRTFTQKANLQQHLMAHRDERPHECDECHKKFITKSKLRQHYQKHVKKKMRDEHQLTAARRPPRPARAAGAGSDEESYLSSPLWAQDSEDSSVLA